MGRRALCVRHLNIACTWELLHLFPCNVFILHFSYFFILSVINSGGRFVGFLWLYQCEAITCPVRRFLRNLLRQFAFKLLHYPRSDMDRIFRNKKLMFHTSLNFLIASPLWVSHILELTLLQITGIVLRQKSLFFVQVQHAGLDLNLGKWYNGVSSLRGKTTHSLSNTT